MAVNSNNYSHFERKRQENRKGAELGSGRLPFSLGGSYTDLFHVDLSAASQHNNAVSHHHQGAATELALSGAGGVSGGGVACCG